ncbi:hypothetical protein D3C74_371090 [compost metagenome]
MALFTKKVIQRFDRFFGMFVALGYRGPGSAPFPRPPGEHRLISLVHYRILDRRQIGIRFLLLQRRQIAADAAANESEERACFAAQNLGIIGFLVIGREIGINQAFLIPAVERGQEFLKFRLGRAERHLAVF